MNVHHDLQAITDVALHYAKEHQCNYNIILMNPDADGKFSFSNGSTYEFVTDSYFEKERPNVIKVSTTDSLIAMTATAKQITENNPDDDFNKLCNQYDKDCAVIDLRGSKVTELGVRRGAQLLIETSDRERGIVIQDDDKLIPFRRRPQLAAPPYTIADSSIARKSCSPKDFGMNHRPKRKKRR